MKLDLATRVKSLQNKFGRPPGLAVVLVGEDPASVIYTSKKSSVAEDLGILAHTEKFSADASSEAVFSKVQELNSRKDIDGILIQRPLPKGFVESEVLYWVWKEKDVDAFHPENVGRLSLGLDCFEPCTPSGVIRLLDYYKIKIDGKVACVVGRSSIVGKPMAALLLQRNATVIHCHSKTLDLAEKTRQADILVAAAGKAKLIKGADLKEGAVVVDIGMHRLPDGKLCGDVEFESASRVASAITPVPGGVGPTTIITLMENTVRSAEHRLAHNRP